MAFGACSFCFGQKIVIPAQAGIQPSDVHTVSLVPGLRRDDGGGRSVSQAFRPMVLFGRNA